MESRIVNLVKELVDIESISGNEGNLSAFLHQRLTQAGYRVEKQTVSGDRHNLFAAKKNPRIVFCTHMDTVAPFIPFSFDGKVLRGRGSCDAKGSMASMLMAGELLSGAGREDIGFLFVVGEETCSDGAKKAAEQGVAAEYIILGEPTDNRIASAQKGTLVFRIEARGMAGHSAVPASGRSALHKLTSIISGWLSREWESDPARGETTLNIGTISGGTAPNVIAPDCAAEGIFRISTSVEKVHASMMEGLEQDRDIEVRIISSSEPLDLTEVPGFESTVVSFGSDAPFLKGIARVVMCGPGSIRYAHSLEEQVSLGELLESVETYRRLAAVL